LGSRVGKGDEEFKKVDYTYVQYSAELCVKLNIPQFSLISSGGADPKSWFLYMRTKGQADEDVMKKNIKQISIFRPGLIKNRDNDQRFGEKIAKFIPFIPKIDVTDLALAQFNEATSFHLSNKSGEKRIYNHSEIEKMVDMKY
jgi:oxidoreductase